RSIECHPYQKEDAQKQIDSLLGVRQERDTDAVQARLQLVREAARAGKNVMPAVMDAVEAYATVGEVCTVLKEVYGTYKEPIL
ncbi:MAG: methylmalonyl-CoA mutase family protein, partial [Planctomycetota bacterium]